METILIKLVIVIIMLALTFFTGIASFVWQFILGASTVLSIRSFILEVIEYATGK